MTRKDDTIRKLVSPFICCAVLEQIEQFEECLVDEPDTDMTFNINIGHYPDDVSLTVMQQRKGAPCTNTVKVYDMDGEIVD